MATNLSKSFLKKIDEQTAISTNGSIPIKTRLSAAERLAPLLLEAKKYTEAKNNAKNRIRLAELYENKYRIYLAKEASFEIAYGLADGQALLDMLLDLIRSAEKVVPLAKGLKGRREIFSKIKEWKEMYDRLKRNIKDIDPLSYDDQI